jgi:hypothetical protein
VRSDVNHDLQGHSAACCSDGRTDDEADFLRLAPAPGVGLSRRHLRVLLIGWRLSNRLYTDVDGAFAKWNFEYAFEWGTLVRPGHLQSVRRTWLDLLEQYAVTQPRPLGPATAQGIRMSA